jgi:hypothetical protein
MSANRITRGGATLAALLLVAALAGCGGGSSSSGTAPATSGGPTAQDVAAPTPSSPQTADAALLDAVLARQEAAVHAYAAVIPHLAPKLAQMAAYFRAQEQEHLDATTKALRGLGAPVEGTTEPIEAGEMHTDRERLEFLYEVEGATIDEELSAISKLEASWPRSLLASTVGNQAQHLTLLRRALGAGPLASVPAPFENGTVPPPGG